MTDKQKACPTAATVGQANGGFADSASLSGDFITVTEGSQGVVSAYLGIGAENAVPGHDLVQLLGLRDLRTLTQLIERERRAGSPICAAVGGPNRGYYLANDPRELERYVKSLDRRLRSVGETRRRMGDALAKLTGQARIEGW